MLDSTFCNFKIAGKCLMNVERIRMGQNPVCPLFGTTLQLYV